MVQTRAFATTGPSFSQCPSFLSSLNLAVWISFSILLPSQNLFLLSESSHLGRYTWGLHRERLFINLEIRNTIRIMKIIHSKKWTFLQKIKQILPLNSLLFPPPSLSSSVPRSSP